MDACSILCFLGILLFLVTVVGHLIWVVFAKIFAAPSASPSEYRLTYAADQSDTTCLACGQRFLTRRRVCPECGLDSKSAEVVELTELEIATRQLAHLAEKGELPAATEDIVKRALDRRWQDVLQRLKSHGSPTKKPRHVTPDPAPELAPGEAVTDRSRKPLPEPVVLEEIPTVRPAPKPAPVVAKPVPAIVIQPAPQVEAAPPAPPPPPRRSFGEMLAGFMEERNILWGELVGGLLIVGCSIALVISLRETLEQIPYFPFLIVGAVAAALIGAGQYTLTHWKLESTSRGLLVIGSLLVPLSFTVLAWVASEQQGGVWELVTEVAAVAVFTWLVRGAMAIVLRRPAGDIVPRPDWLATLAILGASASQLLVPHIHESEAGSGFLGRVAYLPAVIFVLTQAVVWHSVYRQQRINGRQAGALFLGLGLAAYAQIVVDGFILYRTANVSQALEYLAVPVALAGLPLLLGGTIASAKLRAAADAVPPEPEASGLPLSIAGVIATMLALGGTLVMLGALVAAWPQPMRLTTIALVNAAVLAVVAHRFRLVPAYIPAQICLAVAGLTGYHALAGSLDVARPELGRTLLHAWLSPSSGVVLLLLSCLLSAVAEWLARRRLSDALSLGIGGGVAALASLLLVVADAASSPGRAALVFGAVAAGGWLANLRWRMPWLTAVSGLAALGAALLAARWHDPEVLFARQLVWSLIAVMVIEVILALVVEYIVSRWQTHLSADFRTAYLEPLNWMAVILSSIAAVGLIPALGWDWLTGECVAALVLAGTWLVLACQHRNPWLFAAFQSALAVAVLFGVALLLQQQSWDETDIQAFGVGQSALVLVWVAARFVLQRNPRIWKLLEPGWPAVDRLLLAGCLALLFVVTFGVAMVGIADELTPQRLGAEIALAGAREPMLSALGWCWAGLLGLAWLLTLWQESANKVLPGLALSAWCATLLAAAEFGPDIAVASALRWLLALGFLLFSALIWQRVTVARLATAVGIRRDHSIAPFARIFLVSSAVIPVLLLTAGVATLGFSGMQPSGPAQSSIFHGIGTVANNIVPLALLCLGLSGHAVRERSAGYAFAAGLVALVSVAGGYALHIVTARGLIAGPEVVQLGQLATVVTAVWLLGWLAVRRGLGVGQVDPGAASWRQMLDIQHGLVNVSYLLWLIPAVALLAFPRTLAQEFAVEPDLVAVEAGSLLGWLALGLGILSGAMYYIDAVRPLPSWFAALACILIGGLASCTLSVLAPDWDQRGLMLIAAMLSLAFMATGVRWAVDRPGSWLLTSGNASVELFMAAAAGAFAVILAMQRVFTLEDRSLGGDRCVVGCRLDDCCGLVEAR